MNHQRYSCFSPDDLTFWTELDRETYSKFKYGSIEASKQLAARLSQFLETSISFEASQKPLFTSSAFKHIPTASNLLTSHLLQILSPTNSLERIKVHRMNISDHDYAKLSAADRFEHSRQVKLYVETTELVGRDVIVVDDVYFTGAHERNLIQLLSPYARSVTFLYLINLEDAADSMMESNLNQYGISSIWDISNSIAVGDFQLNARTAKYLLGYPDSESLLQFFEAQSVEWLADFSEAIHAEGFQYFPAFSSNLKVLEESLMITPWLSA